jgi:hypothetical protein
MPFQLPNQTSFAQFKPTYSGATWVRPADWITITDTAGEVQLLVSDIVYPVYAITTTFTRTLGTQNIYIDWGDGVVDTITTIGSTTTQHTYTSGGTACSRGYNTWKVRIYGDAGTQITQALNAIPTYWSSASQQGITGLLEEYYGNGTILTAQYLHQTSTNRPRTYYLEYSKLPATMSASAAIFQETYASCINLQKVVMPTSAPNATSIRSMIGGCQRLQEIILPQDMVNVVDCNSFASSCSSLVNVVFPPTMNSSTDWGSAFGNCFSLGRITLPTTNAATSFNSTFLGCRSLLNVEIKSWTSTITAINLGSMFQSCSVLEDVKLPPSITSGATLTMFGVFNGCAALKSFRGFPINFNTTSLQSTFQSCSSLSDVVLPSSISLLTDMSNCFNSCPSLTTITLPTTISAAGINLSNAFLGTAISELVIPSGWILSTAGAICQNNTSLKKISLPSNGGATSYANAFSNCSSLQEIVMPTNMAASQLFGSAFNLCGNLKSIVFPSVMTSAASMNSMLGNCGNLQSVVMPITASTNNFGFTFSNDFNLLSVVMPTTLVGNMTSYQSTFQNCYNLKSVSMPTTQTLNLTTINSMLNNAWNLTGITNTDKIGNPSTTATTYVDGTLFATNAYRLTSLDMYCKFSKFDANGLSTSLRNALTSLRLRNNGAGQYAGVSPQINISYTSLGQAALVQVFNDLPTITSKTIDITGALGAAALTAPERAIATGKGWTIIG